MSKEEIKLLLKRAEICVRPPTTLCESAHGFIIRALAELEKAEKQPEPTELVNKVERLLDDCKYGQITNVEGSNAMIPLLKEACDIIVRQTAEIKELEEALENKKKQAEYGRHKEDCNPKPWENDCKCGFLKVLREANNVH